MLLNWLEISEVSLNDVLANKDSRIDSEFYQKIPPENISYKWLEIGEILEKAQYGISINMNEEGKGYPIYRMNEISDMLCVEDLEKFAAISPKEAEPFILFDRDVLFNRTNSQLFVGRTGLFKLFSNDHRVFASYLIRLKPFHEVIFPEYLVAFLNSDRGSRDIKRHARISINQSNVNAEEVKAVRIPLLSVIFQEKIKKNFDLAHINLMDSKRYQKTAENLLLRAMSLEGWHPPEPLTYTRRASEAFAAGRLDAEHWAPKFDALLSLIKEKGAVSLGDAVTERVRRGISPEYVEDGDILVINSQHVGKTHVILDDNRKTLRSLVNLDGNESRTGVVRKGDVLLNSTGVITIGRSQCVLEDMVAVADNHIAIIRPNKSIDPVYLACFLNSQPGMMQTERGYSGSSGQIELRPEVVEDFLIWLAPQEIQDAVKQSVEMAHRARKESRLLLERAKRAVEIAIEQNEAAALEYLNTVSD